MVFIAATATSGAESALPEANPPASPTPLKGKKQNNRVKVNRSIHEIIATGTSDFDGHRAPVTRVVTFSSEKERHLLMKFCQVKLV